MSSWAPILLSGLLSALLSVLLTWVLSTWWQTRQERRKEKLALLREIMGNRHGLAPGGGAEANARFFQALNSAFAVFHDSKEVIEALQNFKRHKNRTADNVTQLIRRMSEDLKIDTTYLQDAFFDEPFVPGSLQ